MSWFRASQILIVLSLISLAGCRNTAPPKPPPPGVYCEGNPALAAAAREEMGALQDALLIATGKRFDLTVPVTVRPVPAEGRDRWGVPYLMLVGSRVHGGVTFTGGQARLLFPVMPDGSFHRPSLRHELLHTLLLPQGITGHPEEYRGFAYRWRAPRSVRLH